MDKNILSEVQKITEIDNYGLGWAFFKGCGLMGDNVLPVMTDDDLEGWISGFIAAQAEYGMEFKSIEAALVYYGVSGELLGNLLKACEKVLQGKEWLRVPNVPVCGNAI